MLLLRIMIKTVTLSSSALDYSLILNARSRSIRIVIRNDGSMVVSVPRSVKEKIVEEFVLSKTVWIERTLQRVLKNPKQSIQKHTHEEILEYMKEVELFVFSKLSQFNQLYGFRWKKVAVKNVSSRWGSCSSQGNLYFNYKLALLPEHLAEYVVVHELCHLGECNHSPRFWELVAKTIPEYKERRKELRAW